MSLPRAEGMEKSVLSSILQDPELLDEAKDLGIHQASFFTPAHSTLWKYINDREKKGRSVELIGLTADLMDADLIDGIGGPSGLTEVYTYAPTAAHFKHHINGLKEKHALREAYKLATRIIGKIDGKAEIEDVTALLGQPVTAVHELLQGEISNFSIKKSVQNLKDWLKAISSGKKALAMKTGICGLDELYGGILNPSYMVVSAIPGTGKTTFSLDLAYGLLTTGKRGIFFTCEMSEEQLMQRLLIRSSQLEGWRMNEPEKHNTTKDEWQTVSTALDEIESLDLYIHDEPRIHIDTLCATARREHKKAKLHFIVIDYAQLMRGERRQGDSQEREYADISNKLQALMKELKCSVILLSQVTKDKKSGRISTKGAAVFTDDADIWLHIAEDANSITVAKCRHRGHKGKTIQVRLDKHMQRFVSNGVAQEL